MNHHGRWVRLPNTNSYVCNHCGAGMNTDEDMDPIKLEFFHCPRCGFVMDLGPGQVKPLVDIGSNH